MPLNKTGRNVMQKMMKTYGSEKGKEVFYKMEHKNKTWTKAGRKRGGKLS